MNQTVDVGTDVATLFVFHPDDLQSHADAPIDWYGQAFACRPEFEAGTLLAFGTGSDGGFRLRFTDGDLTEAERAAEVGTWTFGLSVTRDRVLADNGDYLPSMDARTDFDEIAEQWVNVANGPYQVTVHALDRSESNDAELADYVLRFDSTQQNLAALVTSPTPPRLEPVRGAEPQAEEGDPVNGYAREETDEPIRENYLFWETTEPFIVPGYEETFSVSDALLRALLPDFGPDAKEEAREPDDAGVTEEDREAIAVASSKMPGTLATIARITGASRSAGEPGKLHLLGLRLVRIAGILPGDEKRLLRVRVEAVKRLVAPLSADVQKALQTAFAEYARENAAYGKTIASPNHEAKRIAQMSDGTALTARLIHHVVMPPAQRAELYALSDAERAKRLLEILNTTG